MRLPGALLLLWSAAGPLSAAPFFIDLSKAANHGPNETLQDSRGVEDAKEKEGFANIPQGLQTFRGIPFQLLDWTKNQGKSYLVLKGRPKPDLPEAVAIPAGHLKAGNLYFLHTCRWGGTDTKTTVAEYDVIYDDGQVAVVPLHVGLELSNFTAADDTPGSSLAWWHKYKNTDMGLSLLAWKNPRPEAPIQTILFKSLGKKPVPILFAITASDKELAILAVSPKPEKTFQTDTTGWIPYEPPTDSPVSTALDMSPFLDAPAGKHGVVKAEGDHLVFEDGTPARFWGTWLPVGGSLTEQQAERLAQGLAEDGYNLVELVDFSPGSEFQEEKGLLERLKAKGVYVLLEKGSPVSLTQDPAFLDMALFDFENKGLFSDGKEQEGPVTFKSDAWVLTPESGPLSSAIFQRTFGKPKAFTVTAHWPNEFTAEAPVMTSTYASFEGWPLVYTVLRSLDAKPKDEASATYEGSVPVLWSWSLPAALAYLRGDLKEGRVQVIDKDAAPLKALIHRSGLQPEGGKFKTDAAGQLKGKIISKTQSLVSDTDQIRWQGNVGLYQVSSPRFQSVVGFLANRKLTSPVWQVESSNRFAALSLISLNSTNLWASPHMLLSAATRMENSGQVYNAAKTKLINVGKAPILLEPFQAKVTLFRYQKDTKLQARALDFSGHPMKTKVATKWVKNNWVITWPAGAFLLEISK